MPKSYKTLSKDVCRFQEDGLTYPIRIEAGAGGAAGFKAIVLLASGILTNKTNHNTPFKCVNCNGNEIKNNTCEYCGTKYNTCI